MSKHPEIPGIMVAMIKVGEETGELGSILTTLSKFYSREVSNAVDTLVGLIEPVMIVFLGLGVGTLLASVLIPIYNLANSISNARFALIHTLTHQRFIQSRTIAWQRSIIRVTLSLLAHYYESCF